MNRDSLAPAGCIAIVLLGAILGGMSVSALSEGDAVRSGRLLSAAVIVVVGGLVLLGAAVGVMVWREKARIDQAQQELIHRAERLRREREHARARDAVAAPSTTAPNAPTIPGKVAPIVGQVGSARPAPLAATPAAVRATKDLGECPVCQSRIFKAEHVVSCPACKATYHRDCWEYNAGCAVFGCKARV